MIRRMVSAPLSAQESHKFWMQWLSLGGIAAVGLALGLHSLGVRDLWLDEGLSAGMAQLSWGDFFKLLWRRDANMGFYFLVLRIWSVLGDSEVVLRLLSVAFSVASVMAVGALGRLWFGAQAGFAAALLLALNAFHLRYAQEVRGYGLLILLVTLSTYFFARMLDDPSTRNRRLYLVTSALAFYTHFFSLLVTAAQLIVLAVWDRQRLRSEPLAKTSRWIAIIYAPGILFLLMRNRGQLDWITAPTLESFYEFLLVFTGQGGPWQLLAYVGACAVAVVVLLRRSAGMSPRELLAYRIIVAWLVLPIVALLLVSLVKPIFVPRYLTMSLPALVLLAGAGLQKLPLLARVVGVGVLVVLASLGVRNYYAGLPNEGEQWRELTHFVVGKSMAGDRLILDNGIARPVFEYYRRSAAWPEVTFPEHGSKITYRDFEGIATPKLIAAMEETGGRVWLIARDANRALEQAMAERFQLADQRNFRGARVQLYVTRAQQIRPASVPGRAPRTGQ
jgi:mannosyltransferase